jgi:hypothetical protein
MLSSDYSSSGQAMRNRKKSIALLIFLISIAGVVVSFLFPFFPSPDHLRSTDAKVAMLELIQSNPQKFTGLDADELSEEGFKGGWFGEPTTWGPFKVNLKDKTYEYWKRYGSSTSRVCTEHGIGEFKWQDGRWIALAPKVSWALGD